MEKEKWREEPASHKKQWRQNGGTDEARDGGGKRGRRRRGRRGEDVMEVEEEENEEEEVEEETRGGATGQRTLPSFASKKK